MRILAKVLMAFALLGLELQPAALAAQTPEEVCQQARQDAQAEVNRALWGSAGFFFGLLGIGAAYVLEPDPPAAKLVGKDPSYVMVYTDCFKKAGRDLQVRAAVEGCVVGRLVTVGLSVLYLACVLGSTMQPASAY